MPALNVWRPLTQVVVFETVWIGPGRGGRIRAAVDRLERRCRCETVGILSKISFSWKMYG